MRAFKTAQSLRSYERIQKINDGTLEEWKKEMFLEVADMRELGNQESRN